MKKFNIRSSKNIWFLSMVIFAAVAASMIFSTCYMNTCIREQEETQNKRAEYKQLGENLANASDYLTAEVRYFAVTGELEHFYNYWHEIYKTKQREDAISTFENDEPPQEEKELLEQAKKYSDILVETETYSMKLVLEAEGIMGQARSESRNDEKNDEQKQLADELNGYLFYVWSYDGGEKYEQMSPEEMRSKAIELLYDSNYENYKSLIMTPIEEFQTLMNDRLDAEVEARREGTRLATVLQIVLAVAALAAIGFVLNLMNHLYIRPLNHYTEEIFEAGNLPDEGKSMEQADLQILQAKIVPHGAAELIHLAEAFNHMIDLFFSELRQRKNAEESMRRAMNEAELANEAKSIFLAQMSHELRTPLNAVNGYTYLLEHTNPDEKQKEYLTSIRYSSNGLLELINQILDFSKLESGKLELEHKAFSLKELLFEIDAIFTGQAAQKKIEFKIVQKENVPERIVGDALRLRQVLVNLLGNAFKFTDEGCVSVDVSCTRREEKSCLLHFAVTDTGIGIEEEKRDKIFRPFTQSDASITRKYGGTGLGLPICSEIIAAAGDGTHTLELESEVGKGSCFYFEMEFLLAKETVIQEEIAEPVDNRLKIPDYRGKTILLTDDSEINLRVQSEVLRLCGVRVLLAASGAEAIATAKKHKDIDLIFMDIRMPQMDGYETAKHIREIDGYKQLPIIALTADAVPAVQERIRDAGMDDCLLKPIHQQELYRLLEKYITVERGRIFDRESCLMQLGGNELALKEIVHRFFVLHREDDKRLAQYLQEKSYAQAEALVHQLKGIMGNLGCNRLQECCGRLQYELREGKTDSCAEFQELWEQTISSLLGETDTCTDSLETDNSSDVEEICEKIAVLGRSYDTEAVNLFEHNRAVLARVMEQALYEKLEQAALCYNFEELAHLMEEFLQNYGE